MIPFILAAVGGYLIGDSMKESQTFANGGVAKKDEIYNLIIEDIEDDGHFDEVTEEINRIIPNWERGYWLDSGFTINNISLNNVELVISALKGQHLDFTLYNNQEKTYVNLDGSKIITYPQSIRKSGDGGMMAKGGGVSDSLKKMAEEIDSKRTNIRLKIATIIGVDKTLMYLDYDYTVSPFKLIETAVLRGFITIDEINEEVWNAAVEEANQIDESYRDSGEGIGSSDMNAFVTSMLNNAGIKIIVVNNRYERA